MSKQTSIQGHYGEIGTVGVKVAEGENIIDLTATDTTEGGCAVAHRLDVAETLELIRALTEAVSTALQNA